MSRIIRTTETTALRGGAGTTLPEAGKIKIGDTVPSKTKDGKDYNRPVSLEYFRATGEYADRFVKQFGEKPNRLLIVFISDDINEVCNQRFDCWEGGRHYGWGDGVNFTVWDPKAASTKTGKASGDYIQVTKESPLLKGHEWKERLTLRFLLPELSGIMGYWSLSTGAAKSSIPGIVKAFDFMMNIIGTVRGIPWELHVKKYKTYAPGEVNVYSGIKIIPVMTVENVEKMHDMISSGASITSIAPIMLNEAKLSGGKKLIESPAIDIVHEEVSSDTATPPPAPRTTTSPINAEQATTAQGQLPLK